MKPLVRGNIEVRSSSIHGFGVFALSAIPANTLIEECYLLPVPYDTALLRSYLFRLNDEECGIPLGCGAIYNHADRPNANYTMDEARQVMCVKTNRPIAKGDEIFISYGEAWFSSRHLVPMQASFRYQVWQWVRHSSLPRVGLLAALLITVLQHVSA